MNNIYYYTATLHKEDVGYSIWIDDLPGCTSQGDNLHEAVANIKEALGLYYEDYKSRQEVLPTPSAPETIKLEENETAMLIEFDARYLKFSIAFICLTISFFISIYPSKQSTILFSRSTIFAIVSLTLFSLQLHYLPRFALALMIKKRHFFIFPFVRSLFD